MGENMSTTIAAIATPAGTGGISIIRISGPQAVEVADRVFRAPGGKTIAEIPGYTALFGHIFDVAEGEMNPQNAVPEDSGPGEAPAPAQPVDEAVALKFAAPRSYTGEDVVELSCHGGQVVSGRALRAVLHAGATPAGPGEFTKRAFLNGKLSLDQAEAVMALIGAQGQSAAKAAMETKQGELRAQIGQINAGILHALAALSAWVDYPDEEIPDLTREELIAVIRHALTQSNTLLQNFDAGKRLREGIPTVIAGSPNVGKSTLMNLLAGCERSIVTATPGTTRDVIEETVELDGLLLCLRDTAGLRETGDEVESIGVVRAKQALQSAELILAVFDSSRPLAPQDREFIRAVQGESVVAILNKMDLPPQTEAAFIRDNIQFVIEMSALNRQGLGELTAAIAQSLGISKPEPGAAQLCGERQYACVLRAKTALQAALAATEQGATYDAVAMELDEASSALLALTGERVTERVADEVFAHFCVGK